MTRLGQLTKGQLSGPGGKGDNILIVKYVLVTAFLCAVTSVDAGSTCDIVLEAVGTRANESQRLSPRSYIHCEGDPVTFTLGTGGRPVPRPAAGPSPQQQVAPPPGLLLPPPRPPTGTPPSPTTALPPPGSPLSQPGVPWSPPLSPPTIPSPRHVRLPLLPDPPDYSPPSNDAAQKPFPPPWPLSLLSPQLSLPRPPSTPLTPPPLQPVSPLQPPPPRVVRRPGAPDRPSPNEPSGNSMAPPPLPSPSPPASRTQPQPPRFIRQPNAPELPLGQPPRHGGGFVDLLPPTSSSPPSQPPPFPLPSPPPFLPPPPPASASSRPKSPVQPLPPRFISLPRYPDPPWAEPVQQRRLLQADGAVQPPPMPRTVTEAQGPSLFLYQVPFSGSAQGAFPRPPQRSERIKLILVNATGVEFTRIVVRNLRYLELERDFPLELVGCSNVTIRNLVLDGVQIQQFDLPRPAVAITNCTGVRFEGVTVRGHDPMAPDVDTLDSMGGLLNVTGSEVVLSDVNVEGSVLDGGQPGVLVEGRSTLTSVNVSWKNVRTEGQPVLQIRGPDATASLTGWRVEGMTCSVSAGLAPRPQGPSVLLATEGARLTASDLRFSDCTRGPAAASVPAGGVNGSSSSVAYEQLLALPVLQANISTVRLSHVTASRSGGMYLLQSDTVVQHSAFTDTRAGYIADLALSGGAIAAAGGTLEVYNSTFSNTTAQGDGGALNLEHSSTPFVLTDCTFMHTVAERGKGGAVASFNGSLALQQCTFINTSSWSSGGAVWVEQLGGSPLVVHNCTFQGTRSEAFSGGAVGVLLGDVAISSSHFMSCSATRFGGALALLPPATGACTDAYTGSSSSGSTDVSAAVHSAVVAGSTFTNNSAVDGGGAIHGSTTWTLLLAGCTLTGNGIPEGEQGGISSLQGGAVEMLQCPAVATQHRAAAALPLGPGATAATAAIVSGGGEGGAAFAHVALSDVTLRDNSAASGGALFVRDCNLDVRSSRLDGNDALENGGALIVGLADKCHVPSFMMTDTNLTGNTASNGGAVYQNLVGLRAVGCRFEGNRAELLGGALLASTSSVLALNGRVCSDAAAPSSDATVEGGGWATDPQTGVTYAEQEKSRLQVFLSGCTFAGNTAGSSAGAVLVDKSDLAVVGSTFSGNAAGHEGARANDQWELNGGALSVTSCIGPAELVGSTFTANYAGGSGGAISAQQCPMRLQGCSFEGNAAASFHGGAVFASSIAQNDSITVASSNFTRNTAGARGDGGGLYVSAPAVVLRDLHCSSNSAPTGSGGAVAMLGCSDALLFSGGYANNSASSGGGAYLTRNTLVQVLGAAFERNTASGSGGGLRVDGCRLVLTNGTRFAENRATRGGAMSVQPAAALSYGSLALMPYNMANQSVADMQSVLDGVSAPGRSLLSQRTAWGRQQVKQEHRQGRALRSSGSTGSVRRPLHRQRRLQQQVPNATTVEASAQQLLLDAQAFPADALASGVGVLVVGGVLEGNSAAVAGGGLHVDSGMGAVVLDGVRVERNAIPGTLPGSQQGGGGGLAVLPLVQGGVVGGGGGVQVLVVSSSFTANTAPGGAGGAVLVGMQEGGFQVYVAASSFANNTARSGGAMSLGEGVALTAASTSWLGNSAQQDGGAIQAVGCRELAVVGPDTLLSSNTAPDGVGGALAAHGCTTVLLAGANLTNNVARSAGAAFVGSDKSGSSTGGGAGGVPPGGDPGCVAIIAGSRFEGSQATGRAATDSGYGGALWVSGRVATLLSDSPFRNNSAAVQGGAVLVGPTCTVASASRPSPPSNALPLDSAGWAPPAPPFLPLPRLLPATLALLRGQLSGPERRAGCPAFLLQDPSFESNSADNNGGTVFTSRLDGLLLDCGGNRTGEAQGLSQALAGPGAGANATAAIDSALAQRLAQQLGNAFNQSTTAQRLAACLVPGEGVVAPNTSALPLPPATSAATLTTNTVVLLDAVRSATGSNIKRGYGAFIGVTPRVVKVDSAAWLPGLGGVATVTPTAAGAMAVAGGPTNASSGLAAGSSNATAPAANGVVLVGDAGSLVRFASADGLSVSLARTRLVDPLRDGPYLQGYSEVDNGTLDTVLRYHLTAVSGRAMALSFELLDALGQVARDGRPDTAMGRLAATLEAQTAPATNCSPPELLGTKEANVYEGVANLTGLRIQALKGQDYRLTFKVLNTEFPEAIPELAVAVSVPPCRLGEVPADPVSGAGCKLCDALTYSLWQDADLVSGRFDGACGYHSPHGAQCYPCPLAGDCPGGAVIFPQEGAWHSAANSDYFIPCQNSEACREGDLDAQNALQQCQAWWYSQPLNFDYEAFAQSVLDNNSTLFPTAPGAAADGTYDYTKTCVLWGLPPDHPASYMTRQCSEGYGGNLCGTCRSAGGRNYASKADFQCERCSARAVVVVLTVVFFVANIVAALVTVLFTFLADYTEDEELAVGDIIKVLIVHCQYFVIITRFNINWPDPISVLAAIFGVITGAVKQVFSPSCLLLSDASPAAQATAEVTSALLAPLIITLAVAGLWLLRYLAWNYNELRGPYQKDTRSLEDYRAWRSSSAGTSAVGQLDLDHLSTGAPSLQRGVSGVSTVGADARSRTLPRRLDFGADAKDGGQGAASASNPAARAQRRSKSMAVRGSGGGMAAAASGATGLSTAGSDTLGSPGPTSLTFSPSATFTATTHPADATLKDASLRNAPMSPSLAKAVTSPKPDGAAVAFGGRGRHWSRSLFGVARGSTKSEQASVDSAALLASPARPSTPQYQPHSSAAAPSDSHQATSLYTAPPGPAGGSPTSPTRTPTLAASAAALQPQEPVNQTAASPRPTTGISGTIPFRIITPGPAATTPPPASPSWQLSAAAGTMSPSSPPSVTSSSATAAASPSPPRAPPAPTASPFSALAVTSFGAQDPLAAGAGALSPGRGPERAASAASGTVSPGRVLSAGGSSTGRRSGRQAAHPWLERLFSYLSFTTEEDEDVIRWAALANIDRTMTWWRQQLLVIMITCFILYPAWATATLQIFACFLLDDGSSGQYPEYHAASWGRGYWIRNMNQECYSGSHASVWVPVGVVCIFVVCLGIPLMSFLIVYHHRDGLGTVHVAQTYGFLYRRYSTVRYYWQAVAQLQTLMLVVVDVFGRVLPIYQRAMLLQIMLIVTMTLNAYFEPTKIQLLEKMEFLSLAVLSVTVSLGLFFVPPEGRKDPINSAADDGIAAIILIFNLGIFVYFLVIVYKHARETLKRAFERAREGYEEMKSKLRSGVSGLREMRSDIGSGLRRLVSQVTAATRRSSSAATALAPVEEQDEEQEGQGGGGQRRSPPLGGGALGPRGLTQARSAPLVGRQGRPAGGAGGSGGSALPSIGAASSQDVVLEMVPQGQGHDGHGDRTP